MKYIREKGKWANGETKYVIEENKKYLKTLPKVEELFSLLCLDVLDAEVSCSDREKENKDIQKFPQYLLSEPKKEDKIKTDAEKLKEEIEKLGVV